MRSAYNRILQSLTVAAMCILASGAMADGGRTCSLSTLKGAYGAKLNGVVQVPSLPERKINAVAKLTFNGAGAFDASFIGRINGDPLAPSTITAGLYSVNADCTGILELTQVFKNFNNVQAAFVIVEQGGELFFVVNAAPPPANPAIIQIDGEADRINGGGERR
ncbi:hypothetical protein [Methylocystis parvus]|uniref:hypothetical protein n=1 Tax=Methylocystis parvus TaxID=134 RepID=UPI003C74B7EB